MSGTKIQADRFICLINGEELDYIELVLNGEIIKNTNDPKFREYKEKFGLGFIRFKITIRDGYLYIEDPVLENHLTEFWDDEDFEEFEERVKFITSIDNWKNKMLAQIDPHAPDIFGLVNTGSGDPNALVIDQPDHILPDWVKPKIESFENGEPH